VPAGVDDAAKVKAEFLDQVAKGQRTCPLLSRERATELLGTMLGGFNVKPLIELLADPTWAAGRQGACRIPCWSLISFMTSRRRPRTAMPTPGAGAAILGVGRVVHQQARRFPMW
jgi:hypothetical protein